MIVSYPLLEAFKTVMDVKMCHTKQEVEAGVCRRRLLAPAEIDRSPPSKLQQRQVLAKIPFIIITIALPPQMLKPLFALVNKHTR